MFNKQPTYTTQDLDSAVQRITRLTELQERAERNMRLNPTIEANKTIYDRLTANVLSATLYLEHLQSKGLK